MPGNDLEGAKIPNSPEPEFMDFVRSPETSNPEAVFIEGKETPDRFTLLQQMYCGEGCAPLWAQLEEAWRAEDTETAENILEIIKRRDGTQVNPESPPNSRDREV